MQVVNRVIMFTVLVSDMPKAKEFYSEKIGLKIAQDYKHDDDNWWVSLGLPEGDFAITLTTHKANLKPGANAIYFATPDLAAAHQELSDKDVKVGDIQNDLFGPGSGAKFFQLEDPDGNLLHITEAQKTPFADR